MRSQATRVALLPLRAGCVTGVINARRAGETAAPISAEDLRRGEEHAVQVGIKAAEILIAQLP